MVPSWGVNANNAVAMMKNIVNVVGNPNVFKPSPYIEVDSFVWDGKTVIRVHVPVSGDVHSYRGDIYDRMGEVDVNIRATAQIADLYMRKKGIYTEREVFPSLKLEDFHVDLLPLVRREAQNHLMDGKRHPWMDMDDEALFRASGLIDEDKVTKETGFNLAAVLLFGKDETLMRICPQYETDALLRVVNVDRYDDRRIVRTNLLDSYDELLEFSRKHLPAPFFLEEDKRLNLREIIVREMVANLLIHREFTSLDKSEFVIERERMYTSNPCNPMQDGRITPENVRPRAKNPIIAGFFREIGRADRLGSGVRNLYKYSKDYGGADPVFTEGNNFVISVSLKKLDPIRFPFGKQPIGGEKQPIGIEEPHIGDKKQPIGTKKPHIGDGKQPIEPKKQPIEEVLLGLQLTRPTYANIMKLYNAFSDVEVFGRALVMKVCGLADGPAGMVIRTMLRHRLLDTVKGHGKGKYRFRSEFSVTNP